MAPRQANQNIQKAERQRSVPKDKKARPQSTKKGQPQLSPRKSARLQERTVSHNTNTEPKHPLPFPTSNTPGKEAWLSPSIKFTQAGERKRKQSQEPEDPSSLAPSEPLRKQRRTSPAAKDTSDRGATSGISDIKTNSIGYWSKEGHWPKEYFNQDVQTTNNLEKSNGIPWVTEMGLNYLLARKRSLSPLRDKPSDASAVTPSFPTPSDQKPRAVKSAPYTHPNYVFFLATKGSFMNESDLSITDASKSLCRILLEKEQTVPQNSLFRDDIFKKTCRKIQDKNEARVVQDITRLIVPSAETLATYRATHLDPLIESVNEGWNGAIPFYGPRPQPDYSVGFRRSAFTDDQLKKLQPFVGEYSVTLTSYYLGTIQMHFPFLACEVKCGAAALEVADRQNAHSMTLAVRGVVELFRLVKREEELHREILAFSISHDHGMVKIYGHYPVIDGGKTTFYRHSIKKFDITSEEGKDKWTSYKFTKNVYDIWMPTHLERICSVIDELPPDLNFEVLQQSEQGNSGLSQILESQDISELSNQNSASMLEKADSQLSRVGDVTPETSVSRRNEGRAFKKRKNEIGPELH